MQVKISSLQGDIGFKAASYELWNAAVFQNKSSNDKEWSGLYIAEDEETATGYLLDAVSGGTGTAYVHKVKLSTSVKLIDCDDKSFETGNIDMKAVKTVLRTNQIDVKDNDLLMPTLGTLGYFFRCAHDDTGSKEIIVPRAMADKIIMKKYKKYLMKNYEPGKAQIL